MGSTEAFLCTPSSSFTRSFRHKYLDQAIEISFLGLPFRNMLIDQPLKPGPMIMVAEVGEFMGDNIVNAITWCFDQVRIQDDVSIGGAASPLA